MFWGVTIFATWSKSFFGFSVAAPCSPVCCVRRLVGDVQELRVLRHIKAQRMIGIAIMMYGMVVIAT